MSDFDKAVATAVTKAAIRAAQRYDIDDDILAHILGVLPSMLADMKSGKAILVKGTESHKTSMLFVATVVEIEAFFQGDLSEARDWLNGYCRPLEAKPIALMQNPNGLRHVYDYLCARHAR